MKHLMSDAPCSLHEFWNALSEWSQVTFGSDAVRGPIGPLKHLIKEANEAIDNPTDIVEYADCVFLIFDAARRAGFTFEQLRKAINEKLEVNRQRTWPKEITDAPMEHKR